MDSGSGGSTSLDREGLAATWREARVIRQVSEEARARARATRQKVRAGRSQREIMHDSAFDRLQARQENLGVIEQAKGIVMGQQRCGPEEAFDLLRRISQRTNIKLRVLAAQIVAYASCSDLDNVTPITAGAARHRRSGLRTRPRAR